MLTLKDIYRKSHDGGLLTFEEACMLYDKAPLAELAEEADLLRRSVVADPDVVTWQIDRNVNTTNVCTSGCLFCNFHCKPHQTDRHFITTIEQYCAKIERMIELGGDQLLLQGGMHPKLGIEFYEELFRELKSRYPNIRLHALGAPEVAHIAKISGLTTQKTLERLVSAGLDSLPGAGAEILVPRVRKIISPANLICRNPRIARILTLQSIALLQTRTAKRPLISPNSACPTASIWWSSETIRLSRPL